LFFEAQELDLAMTGKASLTASVFGAVLFAAPQAWAQGSGGPQSCFDNEQWNVQQARCECVAGTVRSKGAAFGTRQPCVNKTNDSGVSVKVGLGGASGADKAEDDEPSLPPRVPWRGTNFSFITGATTTAVGIGRDNIGDNHESVAMIGMLTLKYALIDQDVWSVSSFMGLGAYVELTESNSSVTEREPQVTDFSFGSAAVYKRAAKKWGTTPNFNLSMALPTSKASRSNGTYLKTQVGAGFSQSFPWFKGTPVIEDMSASFNFKWGHHFTSSTTPVNTDLDRARQTLTGGSQLDDQLTGGRFAQNSTVERIGLNWGKAFGGIPLNAGLAFVFGQFHKAPFENGTTEQCIPIANVANEDCTVVGGEADPIDSTYTYGFQASVGVQPAPELSVGLGYSSSGSGSGQNTLAPDGTRRGFFYSPSAEFALTLTLHPDALYERLTGPKRKIAQTEKTGRTF